MSAAHERPSNQVNNNHHRHQWTLTDDGSQVRYVAPLAFGTATWLRDEEAEPIEPDCRITPYLEQGGSAPRRRGAPATGLCLRRPARHGRTDIEEQLRLISQAHLSRERPAVRPPSSPPIVQLAAAASRPCVGVAASLRNPCAIGCAEP